MTRRPQASGPLSATHNGTASPSAARALDCFGPNCEAVERLWPATSSSPCSVEPLRGTSLTSTRFAQASPAERSSRSQHCKDLGFNLAVLRDAFGVLGDLPRSILEMDDATFVLMCDEFESWRAEISATEVAARRRKRLAEVDGDPLCIANYLLDGLLTRKSRRLRVTVRVTAPAVPVGQRRRIGRCFSNCRAAFSVVRRLLPVT